MATPAAAIGWPAAASSPPDDPIELPDTLSGGLTALDLPEAYPDEGTDAEEQAANRRAADEFNAAGYSQALGGVAAASRVYASPDLEPLYGVVAVRAELSPLLPIDFVDPERLGIAKPTTELVWVGDVSCLVSWAVVVAGGEVADDDRLAVFCQLSDSGITVRIGAHAGETPEHLAELADEVRRAIS